MKSSKDIEPRVGMQFTFSTNGERRKISRVTDKNDIFCVVCDFCKKYAQKECNCTSKFAWRDGAYEIEWIPPTDEERKLFVEFAHFYRYAKCFPERFEETYSQMHADGHDIDKDLIALSLALDGADYDNMPEGFE